ncbi:MAG: hypothetical protein JST42_17250 [Bacteroidetes bacterium]|nr:hypothetical protein [Bacteroidota bacterium]
MTRLTLLFCAFLFSPFWGLAQPDMDLYNVVWTEPGPGPAESMPLGNGDIGLNLWVEPGGDLVFYISKTDAWGDQVEPGMDGWMKQGGILSKVGRVRVKTGKPIDGVFRQVLRLREGEIEVQEGEVRYRVWVDANHPVIRVEGNTKLEVGLEVWRKGDSVLKKGNETVWFHRNGPTGELADICFGGCMRVDKRVVTIDVLTAPGSGWRQRLRRQMARPVALEAARAAHREWWRQFWDRSWIVATGDSAARETTRGYILQRFVTACAGRGAYPIKFNGSIFTVGDVAKGPDYRGWGGMYWFQNTRPMYWPRLMAGDYDMMLPLFKMYRRMLPGNAAQVHNYYRHGGAYFQETTPFWGGVPYMGPEVKENWTGHYFTPILELSMMMLDYYDHTQDTGFAREYLVPVAAAGLQFFDEHFGRDSAGKLLLDPDNSIEMFWKVHDPAPDIAGLRAVIPRMLELPDGMVGAGMKERWRRLLGIVPPLPVDDSAGRLLPYTGPQTARGRNLENPELYAIYPFRLFGLGKPGYLLAKKSFDRRKFREKGCWNQDPIQAAYLGEADVAKDYVVYALTRKDPRLKFPAFWARGHDYEPDQDNGGNGENGLQKMVMQVSGKDIFLLPAWPKGWDGEFKLHAPYNTTVSGRIVHGKVEGLVVTPVERASDVKINQLTYE